MNFGRGRTKGLNMRVVAMAALLYAVVSTAFAQSDDSTKPTLGVNDVFGGFDFTMSTSIDHGSCRVTSTLDKSAFLQNVPTLQTLQMLNPDLTTTDINTKPTMLAAAFTLQMTPVVTKETFEKNPDTNICLFVVNLKEANIYGHTVDDNILSYTFDRATFDKINWDQFEAGNMPKVARQFLLNLQMMARVETESQTGR
jgi:hypothetical protein